VTGQLPDRYQSVITARQHERGMRRLSVNREYPVIGLRSQRRLALHRVIAARHGATRTPADMLGRPAFG
jgi:hypothetical protein